jgi:hypothetical protein
MKATKYLSLAAIALMGTLASCHDDEATAVSFARPDNAVGINVTVGSLQGTTRSNPASADPDEAHLFNLGDQVCVSTDGQDPVVFQCTNADQQTWAEAEAGKFLLWTQSEMTFKAYYPATTGTSMTAFNLPADQSSEAKIAQADYMTRQQTCTNENGTDINLNLERKTARVIVRIAGFNDQYDNDQKTVSNVRINSQFSAIADGNGTGDITEVTPYMRGTGGQGTTFTALVVPGDGDSGARFIQLSDGEGNTLEVKGIPELEAGYSYTYNLTVGKNRILVQSVTVEEWAAGTTLAGGQAQEQTAAAGRPLAEATTDDLGKLAGADGNIYDTKADAEAANTTAVAMITYVGSGSDLAIAIALSDENGVMSWANAKSVCEGKSAVTGAAWILPTLEQWGKVFGDVDSANGLNSAIENAGGTALEDNADYWTSTETSDGKVNTVFITGGSLSLHETETQSNGKARACLAFPTGDAVVSNNGAESPSPFGSAGNPLNQ